MYIDRIVQIRHLLPSMPQPCYIHTPSASAFPICGYPQFMLHARYICVAHDDSISPAVSRGPLPVDVYKQGIPIPMFACCCQESIQPLERLPTAPTLGTQFFLPLLHASGDVRRPSNCTCSSQAVGVRRGNVLQALVFFPGSPYSTTLCAANLVSSKKMVEK